MQFTSRILFGALLALCCCGVANADPLEATEPLDPSVFRAVTNMQLDSAFESIASEDGDASIHGLSGPSSMACKNAGLQADVETCVVTTRGPAESTPTAAVQH